jgi:hypothetical protein
MVKSILFLAGRKEEEISISFDDINNKLSFASTITNEEVQEAMKNALVHAFHTNISVTYNDAQNRFEIQSSGGSGGGGGNWASGGNNKNQNNQKNELD